MTIESLGFIKDSLVGRLKINYEFGEWTQKTVYPYFVGEFQEVEPLNEDGQQESSFIITGFTRGKWIELIRCMDSIRDYFGAEGKTAVMKSGSAVAVCYSNGVVVPTGDAELKRIDINLTVKEWRV